MPTLTPFQSIFQTLESLWNPSGTAAPAGTHYNITQDDLDSYKQFLAEAASTRLVIDTTLEFGNTTKWAVAHIEAVGKTLPWSSELVDAVEIGNEVDLFAGNGAGWGGLRFDVAPCTASPVSSQRLLPPTSPGIRPSSYSYDDYAKEFDAFSKDLVSKAGMPPRTVQGATFCCGHFDDHIEDYIKTFHDRLKTFSYHNYPTSSCHGGTPTLDDLLKDKSTTDVAKRFQPWAKVGQRAGDFEPDGLVCKCQAAKARPLFPLTLIVPRWHAATAFRFVSARATAAPAVAARTSATSWCVSPLNSLPTCYSFSNPTLALIHSKHPFPFPLPRRAQPCGLWITCLA